MEYQRIKYFLAAAEHLNFTRAAETLFVSQQSVTKQIALLEQELGVRLFDRNTRTVTLTPAGEVCYNEFSAIESQIAAAVEKVQNTEPPQCGDISIGFFSFFSADCVIRPIMKHLRAAAPHIAFHVHLYDMYELEDKFFSHQLDMCITTTSHWRRWKDVSVTQIASEPFYVVLSASHPLASKTSITIDDLKNDVFICLKNPFTSPIDKRRPSIPCKSIEYVNNFETLRIRLELGQGFAVLTRVFEGYRDPSLVYFPIPMKEQPHAEVVCAFETNTSKLFIPALSAKLAELNLKFE